MTSDYLVPEQQREEGHSLLWTTGKIGITMYSWHHATNMIEGIFSPVAGTARATVASTFGRVANFMTLGIPGYMLEGVNKLPYLGGVTRFLSGAVGRTPVNPLAMGGFMHKQYTATTKYGKQFFEKYAGKKGVMSSGQAARGLWHAQASMIRSAMQSTSEEVGFMGALAKEISKFTGEKATIATSYGMLAGMGARAAFIAFNTYAAYSLSKSLTDFAGMSIYNTFYSLGKASRRLETSPMRVETQASQTMRQSAIMAIHNSQMGVRSALGREASFMHG